MNLQQKSVVGDFRWTFARAASISTLRATTKSSACQGHARSTFGQAYDQFHDDRRGTNTPFDYANKQGARATTGFTYMLAPNFELIVDGGIRTKEQQAAFSLHSQSPISTPTSRQSR